MMTLNRCINIIGASGTALLPFLSAASSSWLVSEGPYGLDYAGYANEMRSAGNRRGDIPTFTEPDIGFRVVW